MRERNKMITLRTVKDWVNNLTEKELDKQATVYDEKSFKTIDITSLHEGANPELVINDDL